MAWQVSWVTALVSPLVTHQRPVDIDGYMALLVVVVVAELLAPRREALTMALVTLVPLWLWTAPHYEHSATVTAVLALATGATQLLKDRASTGRTLVEQRAAIAAGEARQVVLEERARIAREMHDVVAHRMSLMVVQAESAPYRTEGLPGNVRAELQSLADVARQALEEMRGLLTVLRTDEPDGTVPQPGLADVPDLVASAAVLYLGRRRHTDRPHNVPFVLLGAGVLWFGWFDFNAGSAGSAGSVAVAALVITQLGACAGMVTWMVIEWVRRRKPSGIGIASGAVTGLPAITPASGYVPSWAALVIGLGAGGLRYGAVQLSWPSSASPTPSL
jgi:hypothetical protein